MQFLKKLLSGSFIFSDLRNQFVNRTEFLLAPDPFIPEYSYILPIYRFIKLENMNFYAGLEFFIIIKCWLVANVADSVIAFPVEFKLNSVYTCRGMI